MVPISRPSGPIYELEHHHAHTCYYEAHHHMIQNQTTFPVGPNKSHDMNTLQLFMDLRMKIVFSVIELYISLTHLKIIYRLYNI